MKFALILEPDVIDDVPRRSKLIDALRHTKGVLKLDAEMAGNGLLLADLASATDTSALEKFEGVERVKGMGVKRAIVRCP